MSGLWILFLEFFKIGLFSVGGGLATLPFLYRLADKYDWFDYGMIADMVAVSESTPGPLGVNMATYTGFRFDGVIGGLVATIGLVLPSVVIIIFVSKFLQRFRENRHVEDGFYLLRPAVTGLIAAAGFQVIAGALFPGARAAVATLTEYWHYIGVKEVILFAAMLFLTNKYKKHPVFYIALAVAIGIVFAF